MYQRQSPSHIPDFHFSRDIGIRHGTCANHALFAFALKRALKKFYGVFFNFYIFKFMLHAIASAARVAIDASMRTSAIDVHAIFSG